MEMKKVSGILPLKNEMFSCLSVEESGSDKITNEKQPYVCMCIYIYTGKLEILLAGTGVGNLKNDSNIMFLGPETKHTVVEAPMSKTCGKTTTFAFKNESMPKSRSTRSRN